MSALDACTGCGGKGVGLVVQDGLCGHCLPTAGSKRRRGGGDLPSDFYDGAAGAGESHQGDLGEDEIAAMLAAAEATAVADVPTLDPTGVKQMLLSLERRVTKNALARTKYADEPAKCVYWCFCRHTHLIVESSAMGCALVAILDGLRALTLRSKNPSPYLYSLAAGFLRVSWSSTRSSKAYACLQPPLSSTLSSPPRIACARCCRCCRMTTWTLPAMS